MKRLYRPEGADGATSLTTVQRAAVRDRIRQTLDSISQYADERVDSLDPHYGAYLVLAA